MKLVQILSSLLLLTSCAHVVIPEGGGKDTSPPIIQKYSPPNSSNNILSKNIVITFDENVQISNISENVSITPDINAIPNIKAIKKKLFIEIPKDSLKPNTTYTINFGSSLSDINENNILKSFNYQFSTGESKDTLLMRGHVVDVKENNAIDKCIVSLTKKDIHLTYTTNTNTSGDWEILNISKGVYDLLIYKDKNSNKRLDDGEIYYFETITLDTLLPQKSYKLIQFKSQRQGKIKINKAKYINDYAIYLKLNQGVDTVSNIKYSIANNNQKKEMPVSFTDTRDSLIVYHPFMESDTIQLTIQTDTLQHFTIVQPKKRKKEKLKISNTLMVVREEDPLYFKTSIPFQYINSEKIKLNETFKPLASSKESEYRFNLKHNLKSDIKIIFEKGSVIDINGEESQADTFSIKIAEEEQTGNFEFKVKDTLNNYKEILIVRIFNALNEYFITTEIDKVNKLKALLPGSYSIEIWQDTNINHIWDQGDYYKGIQPEKIILKKDFILIKPNWDTVGVEIYMD